MNQAFPADKNREPRMAISEKQAASVGGLFNFKC